jgi:hypothetical protein
LIATLALTTASGTDLYTRDLALALLRRGWLPIVYATRLGRLAEELRAATIPVVDDLDRVAGRPDVIHGHQTFETLAALAKFSDVPALFVCHGAAAWSTIPPRSPRVRRIIAVDRTCRDRMVFEYGVPADSVQILANAVDLERFTRRAPLPARPRRALVFSNGVSENTFAAPIRKACEARGITLDLAGASSGNLALAPEKILGSYDLVFGKARCALEAAAVGAAVVVCDFAGLAGMMTSASLEAMRALNFGARTLQREITAESIGAEIDRYDAADAAAVCDRIRSSSSIDLLTDQFIALYEEIVSEPTVSTAERDLADFGHTLAVVSRRLLAEHDAASRGVTVSARRALANSRVFRLPARLLYRAMKRVKR